MQATKEQMLEALSRWIRQRPGLESGGDVAAYRAECRSIARDKREAEQLLAAVAIKGAIGVEELVKASQGAFSGRLSFEKTNKGVRIDYCTGQYWPTEYRKAVCAVLASALWDAMRDQPIEYLAGKAGFKSSRGDAIRRYFTRQFGRGLASRWFN